MNRMILVLFFFVIVFTWHISFSIKMKCYCKHNHTVSIPIFKKSINPGFVCRNACIFRGWTGKSEIVD